MMEDYLRINFEAEWCGKSPIEIKGFFREDLAALFGYMGFQSGAEIGVDMGKYSKCLCKNIPNLRLFCVDPWVVYKTRRGGDQAHRDRCFETSKNVLKDFDVIFVRETSMEAVKTVPDRSLDFVYIDGDHRYEFIRDDLREWSRKVRARGIVSGHDYYRYGKGVVKAVHEFVAENKISRWFITDRKHPSSFFWESK
jgi:hypothetical protein